MGLQGVTSGYKRLESVTFKQLGNYASHTEQKLISFEKSKQEFAVYYWTEKCYKLFEGIY